MKKRFKVCVYAICKNEEKHVKRWISSMKEADAIYVLDTGSTDETVKLLKKGGCHVKEEVITPWRFDIARNKSLEMVPEDTDICVCTDLDEVFDKGWRKELERVWDGTCTRVNYPYYWSVKEDGTPLVFFYLDKIHSRKGYCWQHPVHEVLKFVEDTQEVFKVAEGMLLKHYPDTMKSRGSYLPLLELSVKEDPEDDRNMHYLGREYMYYQKWNESIDTLIRHLSLKRATWRDERCASMRYISRCYQELKRPFEAEMWLKKAIEEAPYLREPYVEMATLFYHQKRYKEVIECCLKALNITERGKNYISEGCCWDGTIDDLLAISYYYENDLEKAIFHTKKALEYSPSDERLQGNLEFIVTEYEKKLS